MYNIEKAFKIDEKDVLLITVRNKNNLEIKLLNYGATLVELLTPDRNGNLENIVLTFDDLKDYSKNKPYFGSIIGRTSGRISKGSFRLDDREYKLYKNFGTNHCHGGLKGFSFKLWNHGIVEEQNFTSVEFSYFSEDMEENYPGNLDVKVIYTLTDDNRLIIEYEAISDKRTLCNLTNHAYFNLSGNYKRKITHQSLKIASDYYLELNENSIPTGRLIGVLNTPMDFRRYKTIGKDIQEDYKQIKMTQGYDHPWLLNDNVDQIEMYDDISGRRMKISTTYPSVVIYSYNSANSEKLKYDKFGSKYDGICFETQYEPNGINIDNLSSAILEANERYYEKTEFKFQAY